MIGQQAVPIATDTAVALRDGEVALQLEPLLLFGVLGTRPLVNSGSTASVALFWPPQALVNILYICAHARTNTHKLFKLNLFLKTDPQKHPYKQLLKGTCNSLRMRSIFSMIGVGLYFLLSLTTVTGETSWEKRPLRIGCLSLASQETLQGAGPGFAVGELAVPGPWLARPTLRLKRTKR